MAAAAAAQLPPLAQQSPRLCNNCHEPCALAHRCSRCRDAAYCGPACQRRAWAEHEPRCTKLYTALGNREPPPSETLRPPAAAAAVSGGGGSGSGVCGGGGAGDGGVRQVAVGCSGEGYRSDDGGAAAASSSGSRPVSPPAPLFFPPAQYAGAEHVHNAKSVHSGRGYPRNNESPSTDRAALRQFYVVVAHHALAHGHPVIAYLDTTFPQPDVLAALERDFFFEYAYTSPAVLDCLAQFALPPALAGSVLGDKVVASPWTSLFVAKPADKKAGVAFPADIYELAVSEASIHHARKRNGGVEAQPVAEFRNGFAFPLYSPNLAPKVLAAALGVNPPPVASVPGLVANPATHYSLRPGVWSKGWTHPDKEVNDMVGALLSPWLAERQAAASGAR